MAMLTLTEEQVLEATQAITLPKDTQSFALSILGGAPGEGATVALFTFLTAWVHYEEKVLEANPELALAGRDRLEKHLQRLDKFFDDIFS